MNRPTVAVVAAIAALDDPVLRNLRITQCYHDLAHATAQLVGSASNWCTFATWASRQAGQTIRGEDLRNAAEEIVGSPGTLDLIEALASQLRGLGVVRDLQTVRRTIQDVLRPRDALQRAADAVARGNLKVFAEIGREFARFVGEFEAEVASDDAKTSAFCAALRSGDPPEGQDYLREAFKAYCEARFEPDERAKAQRLFYANLMVGLHEQTRLQPEILEAMNASIGDADKLTDRLRAALLPGVWLRVRHRVARLLGRELPLDRLLDRLIDRVQRSVRLAVSDMLMTLRLPGDVLLRLGRDLTSVFPASLAQVTSEKLVALLDRIDPTPDSVSGTGARDWSDLPHRMHFIADFFRCYHERTALFEAPFTAAQMAALREGRMPEGRL